MIKILCQQASSDNAAERAEAILQIALLLEKHGPGADRDEFYQSMLPEHLRAVSLTAADQAALIQTLIFLIHSPKMTPDMLWALGKTNAMTAFIAVLTWLRNQATFTEDATWQALIVLDNFFFVNRNERGQVDPVMIQVAQDVGMAASLQRVVASGIPKVQPLAEKLLYLLSVSMSRENFLQLLCHVLDVACQEVESTLAKPVAREFVIILHGAGYANWRTTLNGAVEILYLGEDQLYRIIDVAITGVAPNATRVFIRASNHTPTTFAQTWNIPVGYGPFKILVANQVEVLEHL